MVMNVKKWLFLLIFVFTGQCFSAPLLVGAAQTNLYLPILNHKRVAVFVNHTSIVGDTHLIDVLLKNHIHISKIFTPEHGLRGQIDAGKKINDTSKDQRGIPVVSLYGEKLKPNAQDLKDVDILLFDIQDIGVRFYTYISSLQKLMEAAVEEHKPLVILDRPNPNAHYIDGPVLEPIFKSFVGMQPVPIVYGMTIGEYAKMLVGEKWLEVYPKNKAQQLQLTVIPLQNYTHRSLYKPPIKPSPNLPTIGAIYWYPTTALFEGIAVSEGRGTNKPFQVFGHPSFPKNLYQFIPTSQPGAESPKYNRQTCYGWDLSGSEHEVLKRVGNKVQISYLLNAYRLFPDKKNFFNDYFNSLVGNATLMKQIQDNATEGEIRHSWQAKLDEFKKIRQKYLIYSD